MKPETTDAFTFMTLVERMLGRDPRLTPMAAALIAAARLGIAHDSRSFARELDIAHALVLRELDALAGMNDSVRITGRDTRTLRTHYELTDACVRALDDDQFPAAEKHAN